MIDIKKGIARALVEKGWKQKDLAEAIGKTESNFSSIMNKGDFRIHADIEKMAQAMGYTAQLVFIDKATGKIIPFD